jgi:hypothetical protein
MVPLGFWLAIVGVDLVLALATIVALAASAQRVLAAREGRRFTVMTAVVVLAWGALVVWLASRGVFRFSPTYPFPYVVVANALPLLAGAIALLTSPMFRSVVMATPQEALIGIQTTRLLGGVFLVALSAGMLPPVFALPAGIGDVCVGLAAPLVAWWAWRRGPQAAPVIVAWNVAGIIDLVVAAGIGFLASTTPMRSIFSSPTTDLLAVLPFTLIPAFGVPLFLLLHGASLGTLWATMRGRLERRPPVITAGPRAQRPA